MDTSIIDRLDKIAALLPDKLIFKDSFGSLTFGRFNYTTKVIGTYLCRLTPPKKPIAIMSGRHCLTPACFLGVARAGCFYAPMDGDMPKARLEQMLSVIKTDILIVDRTHLEKACSLDYSGKIIVLEDILNTTFDNSVLRKRASVFKNTDPLYVIFTSGSSGKPKGVVTSHLALMTYIDAVAKVLQITDCDVLGCQSPLDYIAAVRDIYIPICFGAQTYIIPKREFAIPSALTETLSREQITVLCWSAAGVELFSKLNGFETVNTLNIRAVCFSGSVISGKHLKAWQDAFPDVVFINQYGPTEATASCTYHIVRGKAYDDTQVPIGKPYENYSIRLLNNDGTPTEQGEIGQICIGGPALALGYYGDRKATEKAFIQNPLNTLYREIIYKTGDLGSIDSEGILHFHGRMDRQIKHMGHRIELNEIESSAVRVNGVESVCALYYKEREHLWLFYTGTAEPKDIVLWFRANMPSFMTPRKLIRLEQLPLLPNGKTDVQTLKQYII